MKDMPIPLTKLLQRLYQHRTTCRVRSGLMRRCERTLAPLLPRLPAWSGTTNERRGGGVKRHANMKSSFTKITVLILLALSSAPAYSATHSQSQKKPETERLGALSFEQITYDAKLSDGEARFLA